jgi:hypothetical protein
MLGLSPQALAAKGIVLLIITAVAFGLGATVAHKMDQGKLERTKREYADEKLKAQRDAFDEQLKLLNQSAEDAQKEATFQAFQAKAAQSRMDEVVAHVRAPTTVTIRNTCIPYGFIRVLDASGLNTGADTLLLPAGKSDDTCSGVDWRMLAERLVGNIARVCTPNAGQLDHLVEDIRNQIKIHQQPKK